MMSPMKPPTEQAVTRLQLVKDVEQFINDYVTFSDAYSLPIALWILSTYCFPSFDAFPYMVITAETKRSGKTRCAEMVSFCCSNPRFSTAMTPSTMFNYIEQFSPTIIFDEAESLSNEAQTVMGQVINAGYRKGSKVPRMKGNEVKEYATYSPKIFILIGDVRDTLRDRSIVVRMKRAEVATRFVHEVVSERGQMLRERISGEVKGSIGEIEDAYIAFEGIDFLTDRDEEIWSPLFVMCSLFCPDRMKELSRIAVDMATEKTHAKVAYVDIGESEDTAQEDEYALRLLHDLYHVMQGKSISSVDAVARLKAMETAPWRKFRNNDGITTTNLADMLRRYRGVKPEPIRTGKKVFKGYKLDAVREAVKRLG